MEVTVTLNNISIGKAAIFRENNALFLMFSTAFDEGKAMRLYGITDRGETVPLGVMLRENNRFTIKKSLNTTKFGYMGEKIKEIYAEKRALGAKVTPPLSFSFEEFKPLNIAIETQDLALDSCIKQGENLLFCNLNNEIFLACPLKFGESFVLAPFFCLITCVFYENQAYGVLKLDGKNLPCFMNIL